ncbi:MAG: hypothetical protein ACXWNG_04230, partial [Candidatus Limnocylindrales bacterium]
MAAVLAFSMLGPAASTVMALAQGPVAAGPLAPPTGFGGGDLAADKARQAAGQPSIQYLDAMAHAGDPDRFTPGDRVTVPFTPRASDRWPVDGAAPRPLAAGRESGRQMAAGAQDTVWPDVPGAPVPAEAAAASAPVDAPANAGPIIAAEGTSARLWGMPASPTLDASSNLRRQVFGFLPYWELGAPGTVLNYDLLSTVAYFGMNSDSAGNLPTSGTQWSGWWSSALTNVINAAHAKGTRVVLTIELFAWTTSQGNAQATFLASPSAQLNLARQAAAAVRARGADGVNVDFEPIVSGYSSQFVTF